ncbi:hypothetical protein V1477_010190 [Vespula maculifrons]|uniref:Uncharacterized protein n=1 Tax=Vespula maculifrons TaxID=7453 RepID=A0ABD2C7V4_VESMC
MRKSVLDYFSIRFQETRWDGSGGKGQWNDEGNAIALQGWHFHDYARIGKERIAQGKKRNFIQRPSRACDLFRLTALLSASGINGQTGRRAEGGFRGGRTKEKRKKKMSEEYGRKESSEFPHTK